MLVSYKQLVEMLTEAYDVGMNMSSELREQSVEEIIGKVDKDSRELRIYTVEELCQFPVDSKFCHTLLGKGIIVTKKGVRSPFMKFESGVTHAFATNQFPWDMPMVYLGETWQMKESSYGYPFFCQKKAPDL